MILNNIDKNFNLEILILIRYMKNQNIINKDKAMKYLNNMFTQKMTNTGRKISFSK